jgi:hypothetical protein
MGMRLTLNPGLTTTGKPLFQGKKPTTQPQAEAGDKLVLPRDTGIQVPANVSFIKLNQVCQELEARTPQWYMARGLATGMADYYNRLARLLNQGMPDEKQGIILSSGQAADKPLLVSPEAVKLYAYTKGRFDGLNVAPEVKALSGLTPQQQVDYLQPRVIEHGQKMQVLARDLYSLLEPVASFLEEPEQRVAGSDVKGFLEETDKIRRRTPEWYQNRGMARAVVTYFQQLDGLLRKSGESGSTPGLDAGPSVATDMVPFTALERLEQAKSRFERLCAEHDLGRLKGKTRSEQLDAVHQEMKKSPETVQQLANDLHKLVKLMVVFLAQEQLGKD